MENCEKHGPYSVLCTECDAEEVRKNSTSTPMAGYVAEPAVRRKDSKTLLIIGGVEHVLTTEQALDLAENLKSAAFLAGDY